MAWSSAAAGRTTMRAGQRLEIEEIDDGIWLVSFSHYDLGYFDLERELCNPSTTRSPRDCHPCTLHAS
jgi:hypothetical protein